MSSFSSWLSCYAGLVKSLNFQGWLPQDSSMAQEAAYAADLRNALLAAMLPAAPAAAEVISAAGIADNAVAAADHEALAATANVQQQQQHEVWRLASFSSGASCSLDVLDALPAHSLTALELDMDDNRSTTAGAALVAVLSRLSCLQHLKLSVSVDELLPASYVSELGQLTRLTLFDIDSELWLDEKQSLQMPQSLVLLRHLRLGFQELFAIDLSHLTQLQSLILGGGLPEGSVLPPQLTSVDLGEPIRSTDLDVAALLPLQQLQHLKISASCFDSAPQLLQIASGLPWLQHLSLYYYRIEDTASAARAWQHLPALQEIGMEYTEGTATPSQMETILQGIAAATSLTNLELIVEQSEFDDDAPGGQGVPVAACARLAGLKNLRELCITRDSNLVPGDALALTALTGLTRLVLANAGDAVDDTAACALARCLKQLRHLDLSYCSLGSMTCLPAIAHLYELTELRLNHSGGESGMTEQGLMLLTGLSNLQHLNVENCQLPDGALARLWAALRQRQQQ
jgi:hypothetical protein